MSLEKLLLEVGEKQESIDKLIEENKESALNSTVNNAIQKFIVESTASEEDVDEEDDDMDYEESDVDIETGMDSDLDSDEEPLDGEDNEDPIGGMDDESDEEGEMPVDLSVGMSDDNLDNAEEEVMDMTNATAEEVMDALNNLPDNAKIEVVKKSSFDIDVDGSEGEVADTDLDIDMPLGEEMDTNESEEMNELDEMMKEIMETEEEEVNEEKSLDETLNETLDEMMKEMEMDEAYKMDETIEEGENHPFEKSVKANQSKGGENAPFEKKGKQTVTESQLRKRLNQLVKENKRLKVNEAKAIKTIKKTFNKLEELAVVNSQLAYTTRLFTEHSTTRRDKEDILKKMHNAKTVRESKLMFNLLKENLEKRVSKRTAPIGKPTITEGDKKNNKKQVVKEEVAFVNPEQQRIIEMMHYKPKS